MQTTKATAIKPPSLPLRHSAWPPSTWTSIRATPSAARAGETNESEARTMTLVRDLNYDQHGICVLRRVNEEPHLWAYRSWPDEPTYALNDCNTCVELAPDEDIDAIVADWERAVGWGDESC